MALWRQRRIHRNASKRIQGIGRTGSNEPKQQVRVLDAFQFQQKHQNNDPERKKWRGELKDREIKWLLGGRYMLAPEKKGGMSEWKKMQWRELRITMNVGHWQCNLTSNIIKTEVCKNEFMELRVG
jgi:hypothetical protein